MSEAQVLGKYKLGARLAAGGMGEVWEGEGPDGAVAIKLIPEFLLADPALLDRLRREALGLARLRHPGVVRFLDFGVDRSRAYLVMERLRGETLAERLAREQRLAPAEAKRIAAGIAGALAYIHARGLIHRDLKPQNIFLTEAGGVKLIDLGVAKVLDEASLTVTGSHFGTPGYMAPESFRDAKRVTEAVDVWSLGVILYELVTGQSPFPGTTAAATVAKIANPKVVPQSPAALCPGLPAELTELIGKCLNRDPGLRPASDELAFQLTGKHPGRGFSSRSGRSRIKLFILLALLGCTAFYKSSGCEELTFSVGFPAPAFDIVADQKLGTFTVTADSVPLTVLAVALNLLFIVLGSLLIFRLDAKKWGGTLARIGKALLFNILVFDCVVLLYYIPTTGPADEIITVYVGLPIVLQEQLKISIPDWAMSVVFRGHFLFVTALTVLAIWLFQRLRARWRRGRRSVAELHMHRPRR